MSAFNDIADAVMTLAETAEVGTIYFGSTPPDNGICLQPQSGSPTRTMLNKGMVYATPFVCNAKNKNQQTAFENLSLIHAVLTKTLTYPEGDHYQIINIDTTSGPSLIDREENSQYIYGSSFTVTWLWR